MCCSEKVSKVILIIFNVGFLVRDAAFKCIFLIDVTKLMTSWNLIALNILLKRFRSWALFLLRSAFSSSSTKMTNVFKSWVEFRAEAKRSTLQLVSQPFFYFLHFRYHTSTVFFLLFRQGVAAGEWGLRLDCCWCDRLRDFLPRILRRLQDEERIPIRSTLL